ncbi:MULTISPECIES: GvpT/GvpP family gas vesicle accessory protein [Bacillus]|uniref:GvpT/GvpP family gas vesicle accessory protein n=1 Tax=Bacillus TaxID=1386 RepID=UPI000BB815D6|nr:MULTISPECIES: GvpT/GvpP family gas vesicle accessory protein [Bacillus]
MTVKEKEEQNEDKNNKDDMNQSYNLAIIGGVVGAGIGLLSSPNTSKKVWKSLSESEVMKVFGNQLKRSAQEILAEQAQKSIKQFASGYVSKNVSELLNPSKKEEKDESDDKNESSEIQEMKQDNEKLNERLDKIESMLNKLVDSNSK